MVQKTHLILLEWPIGRTKGGPSGYLWHLKRGLDRSESALPIEFVTGAEDERVSTRRNLRAVLDSIRPFSEGLWRLVKTHGGGRLSEEVSQFTSIAPEDWFPSRRWSEILKRTDIASVHCHTTHDALSVHNELLRLGRRSEVKLILTSHCPEMPGLEKLAIMRDNGLSTGKIDAVRDALLRIDLHAFKAADVVIFPSKDAVEPYLLDSPEFQALFPTLNVRYVLTGIEEPVPQRSFELPELAEMNPRHVWLYVGRHNSVKGYDLLTEALPAILDRLDAVLLVAGAQGPLFAPKHRRWIELGRVEDVAALMRRADLFILPNRQTYFDLVALEALAAGLPILASDTGGNRTLHNSCPGVTLFRPTVGTLQEALVTHCDRSDQARALMGSSNRRSFESSFTADQFASEYRKVIEQILDVQPTSA